MVMIEPEYHNRGTGDFHAGSALGTSASEDEHPEENCG
jgi:hypothetical protein